MAEIVMFPMEFVSFKKEDRECSIIRAISSKRVVKVIDLPLSWEHTDSTLAITRLISAGWEKNQPGKGEPMIKWIAAVLIIVACGRYLGWW